MTFRGEKMGRYSKKFIKEEEIIKRDENGSVVERKVRTWSLTPISDKDFVKFFDAFVMDLLQDEDIAGKSIRLLFYIASILDYEEEIFYLSPSEVAKELNVNPRTIFRWLKTLIDKGLIIKTNRRNWYMVNRKCIYRGSVIRADVEELEKAERKVKYGSIKESEKKASNDND
jgi:predicted transcriptional regulator